MKYYANGVLLHTHTYTDHKLNDGPASACVRIGFYVDRTGAFNTAGAKFDNFDLALT